MENYTITKEQILELHESNSPETRMQIAKMFPEAFKKELLVGKWYKHGPFKFNYQGGIYPNNYGWDGFGNWTNELGNYKNEEAVPMTDDEVKKALIKEVIKRFGKDWDTAEIEKCLINGKKGFGLFIIFNTNVIWNKNGCIYNNGVFAEPLKSKVISIEKAEKILSEKYGKTVEIK